MNMKKFVARKAFPMICAAFISVVIAGCGDDSSNSTPSAPATTTPAVNPTDNSTTDPATNPTTDPATNPTTDPTTDPTTTDPSTTTDPVVTDPTTDPSTNPTDPTTDPTNPTVDPTTPTVSSFNRDPAAAGLAVTPDSTGFYDIGDVYKAVPATSKLVFVMRHAERQTSEGQESLLTEKGVEQALSVGAKLTKSVIVQKDGIRYYRTGDKGYLDEDGFLTIVDRYSRFAKLGGEMISLGAVEKKIQDTPVLQGCDYVVTAIPDATKGEKIVLLYQGEKDPKDVLSELRASGMPPLMLPSAAFNVDVMPKLGSGKADFVTAKKMAKELVEKK